LAVIIPAQFDSVLDATNPFVDKPGAIEEAELRLRFWLAYQLAFEKTGSTMRSRLRIYKSFRRN